MADYARAKGKAVHSSRACISPSAISTTPMGVSWQRWHTPQGGRYTQTAQTDDRQGTVRAEKSEETIDGIRFRLYTPNGRSLVETGLFRLLQRFNLLAVAAVLLDAGLGPTAIAERLALLTPPAGRLERIGGHNSRWSWSITRTLRCLARRAARTASDSQCARCRSPWSSVAVAIVIAANGR